MTISESRKIYIKKWRALNKDKWMASKKAWRLANLEKDRAYMKQYLRKWQTENKDKVLIITKRYQKARLLRTPKWLTKSDWAEINWAYALALQKTKETGIPYEVDHIIPLQGKNISGLHCPQNLQVIPAIENSMKGNRFNAKYNIS